MNAPRRIAFFGGTFDPIHEGHLEIARKAQRALQLDQVIFLPCRRSPHKDESPGANDLQRLEMIQLAISEIPWASVSDYELAIPPPSFTWQTLEVLLPAQIPPIRPFLLIGFDQWEALPRWQHPEKIAEMVEFIVVGRGEQATVRPGYRAHFLSGNHPASASQIRQALASGQKPQWLAPAVRTYLEKNGLYQ